MRSMESLMIVLIAFMVMFTVLDLAGLIPWTLIMSPNMTAPGYFAPFVNLIIVFIAMFIIVGVTFALVLRR